MGIVPRQESVFNSSMRHRELLKWHNCINSISVLKKVSPNRQHGSARWSCAGQLPAQSPRGEVVTA